MKKFIAILLLVSTPAISGEVIIVNKVFYDFDTHVRVGVSAQILEAPDHSLIGQPLPYIQSLRYSASKQVIMNQQFSNLNEINLFMRNQLCQEIHEVTLNAIRDSGTKGNHPLIAKMKPKSIAISALHVTAKGKVISQSMICK
jgi:hypothetical protein